MGYKVAIVGATGNVGREMLNILEERGFPVSEVVPLASRRSLNTPALVLDPEERIVAAYGRLDAGRLRLIGELARTTRIWPGSRVPDPNNPLSIFPASRVTAFTAGARYRPAFAEGLRVSAEYSKFIAGAVGSQRAVRGEAGEVGHGRGVIGSRIVPEKWLGA